MISAFHFFFFSVLFYLYSQLVSTTGKARMFLSCLKGTYSHGVRPLLCVSCVPASCVLIWFVSCPRFLWLWVNSCPAVFVSLSMIILCIYSHVCSVWYHLVYSLLPVFLCVYPALSTLQTLQSLSSSRCSSILSRVCIVTHGYRIHFFCPQTLYLQTNFQNKYI